MAVAQARPLASYTVDWVKASVAVRCKSVPRAVKGPMAACIKLVFISMVTTPLAGVSLRAAVAIDTSSKVIKAPPCVTPRELACSARGAKAISELPCPQLRSSKPKWSTKGMRTPLPASRRQEAASGLKGGVSLSATGHHADAAVHRQPLAGDVFARVRGVQKAQAFQVFVITQALERRMRGQAVLSHGF